MRILVLFATLAACDSGPRVTAPPTSAAFPTMKPQATVAPPYVAPSSPPPSTPGAQAEASVPLGAIVAAMPPMEATSRARTNPYLETALMSASHGSVGYSDDYHPILNAILAVTTDPASAQARFAAACLLAQGGHHDLALEVLRVLHDQPSCTACGDALVNVHGGECSFDAKARALVADVKPGPMWTAADAILTSLNSGDASRVDAHLDDGTIAMQSSCSVCDEDRVTTQRLSAAAFRTYVKGAEERLATTAQAYRRPVFMFCDARCCTGPTGYLSHSASSVTSICFRGGPTAPKLASISTLDG